MFRWTPEMVQFMLDAAQRAPYAKELAAWLSPELSGAFHVCDAGCGLGFLSLELAKKYPHVTAADVSEDALAALKSRAQGMENLTVLKTDLMEYIPPEPFDAMVFCLFGRTGEILRIAKRCCKGRVVILKKAYARHRFSVTTVPLRDETAPMAAGKLTELGIPFTMQTREFEMGQPLRSLDAAMRFFEIYSKDAPGALTREAVCARLVRTGEEEFPYYLPQKKALGLISLRAEDIWQEV